MAISDVLPQTEEELAADAAERLLPDTTTWAGGHDVVQCVNCGDVLKNRYGQRSPNRACPRRSP